MPSKRQFLGSSLQINIQYTIDYFNFLCFWILNFPCTKNLVSPVLVLKCGYHSSRVSPFSTLARANENQISPTVAAARPARRVPAHPADAGTPRSGKKEKLFRKIVILQLQQNQVRPMCGGCAHFGANKSHLICVTIVMQNVLRLLRLFWGGGK